MLSQVFAFFAAALFALSLTNCSKDENKTNEVVVQRAEFNQPAIEVRSAPPGQADALLVETQGYEQARDRLLQMDVMRRLGRGQLSELFGAQSEKAEARDRFLFGLGLPQAVEKKVEFYQTRHAEEWALLEAFSRGVNRWIAEMSTKDVDTLRLYRQLARDEKYVPRNWEPADTLAVAQNIAFYLSSRLQAKLSLGIVSMTSDDPEMPLSLPNPAKLTENLDTRSVVQTFIMDADRSQNPWLEKLAQLDRSGGPKRKGGAGIFGFPAISMNCVSIGFPVPECGQQVTVGSNSFVAGRGYTGNKDVIIGNDPHLLLAMPMTFYEGAYDSTPAGGSFKVRGFNLPGIPLVLIGHNAHLGWGLTNLAADVDDIYLESLQGEKGDRVRRKVGGQTQMLQIETKVYPLLVRNRFGKIENKEVAVRFVPGHGPIFTDHEPGLITVLAKAEKIFGVKLAGSYKWVGHEPSAEFVAIVGLGRSITYRDTIDSLNNFGAGAQNVVIGTRTGDIGYYAHGDFPVRNYISDSQPPFIPVVTITGGDKEWAPEHRKEIPQLFNPEAGRIVTANNDPFGHSARPRLSEWEDYFSVWFSPGVRAARIQSILDGLKGGLNLSNASKAQFDHKDLLVDSYLELLRAELAKGSLKLSPQAAVVAKQLADWDATMESDRTEPVIAEAWIEKMIDEYMAKYISLPGTDHARYAERQTTLLVRTAYHKLADFLGGDEDARADGIALLEKSLEGAVKVVETSTPNRTWGQQHRLEFANALDGILPSFSSMPFPRKGSPFTVDLSAGPIGPGFRMLMRVPEQGAIEAIAAVPGGNFGSSDTKNVYRELVPWLKGQYRALVPFVTP